MANLRAPRSPRPRRWWVVFFAGAIVLFGLLLATPPEALAGPRSGGSFGGRVFRGGGGFNSSPGSTYGRGYGYGYGGGSRPSFFFLPSFGWGWGGAGYGGGGFGSLLVLAVLGIAAFSVVRVARRYRGQGSGDWSQGEDSESEAREAEGMEGRAYVYRMQIALGRSARAIQDRLDRFASEGDTATEAGLAGLLQQTALELMREKDSICAASVDASGPMSLTNAETKLNGLALAERARFQVERVRASGGSIRRSEVTAQEAREALEFVVITVVVATRTPLGDWKRVDEHADLEIYLGQLGAVSPAGILGLEVVWTPADSNDSLTETDLLTTYPELRSL